MTLKKILMICSWLDHEGVPGIFFREQAAVVRDVFGHDFVLLYVRKYKFRFRVRWKNFLRFGISSATSPEGLPVIYFDYPSFLLARAWYSPLFYKLITWILIRHFKRNKLAFNLIHAQGIINAGIWSSEISKRTGIPFVFTEHDQFSLKGVHRYNLKLIQQVINTARVRMVVSFDKIRQFAGNRYFHNFQVVGNLVDDQVFQPQTGGYPDDCFRIITVGAFSPFKDHVTMFKSLQLLDALLSESDRVEFWWVGGSGWFNSDVKKSNALLQENSFKNIKLNIQPIASRQEVADLLNNSNVFLFTSISEGMPVSVLEALACGLPVVTTRCGGVDELINESNGTIVQIQDDVSICDALYAIVKGTRKYDKAKISEGIIRRFGRISFASRLNQVYSSVKH